MSSCVFFPTCQVRVVRFYGSCLLLSSSPLLLLLLNRDPRRTVFSVGPQPRPSTPSVPCRTSTTTIPAQCSLPDLNHDHPRPVFPAGPQPRVSTPSVPCRTSCRKIWDKECAEECANMSYCLLVSCSQFAQQAFGLEDKRARDETTLAA